MTDVRVFIYPNFYETDSEYMDVVYLARLDETDHFSVHDVVRHYLDKLRVVIGVPLSGTVQ